MWLERDDDYRWNSGINCILGIQDRGPGHLNRNLFTVERLRALIEEARFNVEICQAHPTRTGHIENGDILCRAVKPIKSEINVSRTDPSKAKSQAVRLDQSWIRAIDEAKTGRTGLIPLQGVHFPSWKFSNDRDRYRTFKRIHIAIR